MAPSVSEAEEPEVLLLEAGVACDVGGVRSDDVGSGLSRKCSAVTRATVSSASLPVSCARRGPSQAPLPRGDAHPLWPRAADRGGAVPVRPLRYVT